MKGNCQRGRRNWHSQKTHKPSLYPINSVMFLGRSFAFQKPSFPGFLLLATHSTLHHPKRNPIVTNSRRTKILPMDSSFLVMHHPSTHSFFHMMKNILSRQTETSIFALAGIHRDTTSKCIVWVTGNTFPQYIYPNMQLRPSSQVVETLV